MHIKSIFALALCCFMPLGTIAATVTVDGVRDGSDSYSNSFDASWTNGHKTEFSIYADGSDTTTVYYEMDSGSLFLYMEVPLYAKNMIWGTGATDVTEYQDHWLTHHGGTFVMDYNAATGSEKAVFAGNAEAKLKDDSTNNFGGLGLLDSATSRDWVLLNGCDTTNCAASTVAMSFEFQFDLAIIDEDAFLAAIEDDGIVFHLSPERRISEVPLPAAAWLFGSALLGLGAIKRRKA